jgi:hypothetical protein
MPLRVVQSCVLCVAASLAATAAGQAVPYNPYVDSQGPLVPVAPDGTIRWGVFYKSAALQKSYERLWNLGACRGTNKAITIPVGANKLHVDELPEAEFRGVVRGADGTLAGGLVAFLENPAAGDDAPPLVAQLHPAGVSRLVVVGESSADVLRPGMTVRLATVVDARGRAAEAVRKLEIVSPPADARPAGVVADEPTTVVATVTHIREGAIVLRVDAGRIRKLTIPLDPAAVATIDAPAVELISAGDAIEVKGRLWTGEGALGAGTVFASDVLVRKQAP